MWLRATSRATEAVSGMATGAGPLIGDPGEGAVVEGGTEIPPPWGGVAPGPPVGGGAARGMAVRGTSRRG
ncbi:hypothetical protein GCM10010324_57220 [Streptomyces hiroshimensis]|uniref:Uncharacterized protein n=1 Tax=Streptomyces hiroshimensis TaxID=66424 RepID=A0ABQ2Z550_9ACTN|nr:hypothetical protein GCM10010324_57220 [Streptomyces hiroshimensis]